MKRKSDCTLNNNNTKRNKFYLLDRQDEVLESGSKRKLNCMKGEYSHFMSALKIVDEPTFQNIKRRKLLQEQREEYEIASLIDSEASEEQTKQDNEALLYEKLRQDFKDPVKRREILYDSYRKLLYSK